MTEDAAKQTVKVFTKNIGRRANLRNKENSPILKILGINYCEVDNPLLIENRFLVYYILEDENGKILLIPIEDFALRYILNLEN